MLKALKSTLLIAAVCVPTAFIPTKAQAYESWEIPFSNETFNAPMQREQGGQEYGNNWCQGVWNARSSWKPYVASVDGRQIATLSVNHIWYHWDNRQCIANINGTAVAPDTYGSETQEQYQQRLGGYSVNGGPPNLSDYYPQTIDAPWYYDTP
jgi:hypothetical protein